MSAHPYLVICLEHGTPIYAEGYDTYQAAHERRDDVKRNPRLDAILWEGIMDGSDPPAPFYTNPEEA